MKPGGGTGNVNSGIVCAGTPSGPIALTKKNVSLRIGFELGGGVL